MREKSFIEFLVVSLYNILFYTFHNIFVIEEGFVVIIYLPVAQRNVVDFCHICRIKQSLVTVSFLFFLLCLWKL